MLCSTPELTALFRINRFLFCVCCEASDYSNIFGANLAEQSFSVAGLVQLQQHLFVNSQFLLRSGEHRQLELPQVDGGHLALLRLVARHVDQQRILATGEVDVDVGQQLSVEQSNIGLYLGSVGFKINPAGRLLLVGNVLIAIGDNGLQDSVTPVFGIDYSF